MKKSHGWWGLQCSIPLEPPLVCVSEPKLLVITTNILVSRMAT